MGAIKASCLLFIAGNKSFYFHHNIASPVFTVQTIVFANIRIALNKFRNTKAKKFRESQKLTWLKQIERKVKLLDFDLE